jgi:hypothetical protein
MNKVIDFLDFRPVLKELFFRRYNVVRSAAISLMAALLALGLEWQALYVFTALPFVEGFLRLTTKRFMAHHDEGIERAYDVMFTFAFMYALMKGLMLGDKGEDFAYIGYILGYTAFYIFTMMLVFQWKHKPESDRL